MHWRQSSSYRDDVKFIKEITERVDNKINLINSYSVFWSEIYEQEKESHKKENAAIRQANIRLRQMIKDTMRGEIIETVTPPVICGNCHYLSIDNMCMAYRQVVPDEFINKENDCEQYKNGVPF